MSGLVIRHGSPNWWLSPDIWVANHPSTSTSPSRRPSRRGAEVRRLGCGVRNPTSQTIGSQSLSWNLQAVWAIPTAGPIPLPTSAANAIDLPTIFGIPAGQSVDFKSITPWIPVFENGGHECLVAWTNVQQHCLSVNQYPISMDQRRPRRHATASPSIILACRRRDRASGISSKYAFQVCNGADEERSFVVAARQTPCSKRSKPFFAGVPGGRAILDKPGKVERLGIVASADPSAAELEQARAELTVKIAGQSCRRFTFGGVLLDGQCADQRHAKSRRTWPAVWRPGDGRRKSSCGPTRGVRSER